VELDALLAHAQLKDSHIELYALLAHAQLKDEKQSMTVARACALHAAGIVSLEALALSEPDDIQRAMVAALPRNMRGAQTSIKAGAGPAAKCVRRRISSMCAVFLLWKTGSLPF